MVWNTAEKAIKTETNTRPDQKGWASSLGLCKKSQPQHPRHLKVSSQQEKEQIQDFATSCGRCPHTLLQTISSRGRFSRCQTCEVIFSLDSTSASCKKQCCSSQSVCQSYDLYSHYAKRHLHRKELRSEWWYTSRHSLVISAYCSKRNGKKCDINARPTAVCETVKRMTSMPSS